MKVTTQFEVREIYVTTTILFWCGLAVVHVVLAVLASLCVLNRRKTTGVAVGRTLLAAWLIPVVGPVWVLWRFRPSPQPPLL
jgi:hypothetical protein